MQRVATYLDNSSKRVDVFFMFKIGKNCLGFFVFKLEIDQKGLVGLGLIKLLWFKGGYYGNEGLAWDLIKACKIVWNIQERIKVSRDCIKVYKITQTQTLIAVIHIFNQKRWLKKGMRVLVWLGIV